MRQSTKPWQVLLLTALTPPMVICKEVKRLLSSNSRIDLVADAMVLRASMIVDIGELFCASSSSSL